MLRAIEVEAIEGGFRTMRAGDPPIYRRLLKSEDAAEGVRVFVEKRKPVFRGSRARRSALRLARAPEAG